MKTILAALVLTLVCAVLWGVGAAIRRLTGSQWRPWPVSIGVGLAATIAAGGLLNLAHAAFGPVLWTLAAIGLAISLREIRHVDWKIDCDRRAAMELASAAIVIGLAAIFAMATQLPPKAFNSHDDFEKYFAYPVRMLETGTLSGSPLSALGSEALGGQSFLDGLVLSVLPIGYINGVDAVFGLAALLLLAASAGWKRFGWFPGALLGPLLIAAINPQYANVSSLYCGALLMATAVMLVDADGEGRFPNPLALGLVYGSMFALKPTFAIFPACHLVLLVLARRFDRRESRSWAAAAGWGRKTVAWACAFVAPWILLHVPNYLGHGSLSLRKQPVPSGLDGNLNLLSPKTLFWGASFLDYTGIAVVAGAIAMVALAAWRSETEPQNRQSSLAVMAGATSGLISYLIAVPVLGKAIYGYAPNLRLAIPSLLGACVTSIVISPAVRGKWKKPGAFVYFPLLASLAICAAFLPSMIARYRQAARFGSILAFADLAQSPEYVAYNQFWLSPAGKQYILALQEKVPAGEPLLAWINTPFLLDYRRNVIVDADTDGIASPWARIPAGVRYVLWQYAGPEVRKEGDYIQSMHGAGYRERMIAARSLSFASGLSQAAQHADVIASDGYFVLFRLRAPL